MNKTKSIVAVGLIAGLGLAACSGDGVHRNPGKTYAPDMVYSVAYDAYSANPNFADGMSSRLPVEGTIARGHELPDHLRADDTGAQKSFKKDIRFTEAEVAEGGRLYNIYCGICHGTNMDGNGPLYASGKFAAMPANLKDAKNLHMSVGQIYSAIKFGKNAMGSYASQLNIKQRWQVIAYIKKVQSENGGDAFAMGATTAEPGALSMQAGQPVSVTDSATHTEAAHGTDKENNTRH